MDKNHLLKVLSQLKDQNCIKESDILCTHDGFWLIYKPISAILGEREIFDFLSGDGQRLECDSFFDDWFLYAMADGDSPAKIERCKEMLAQLLSKVDTLLF